MNDEFFALHLDSETKEPASPPPSGWAYLSGAQVRCVFSTTKERRVGRGDQARADQTQTFWFMERAGRDDFRGHLLNDRHVPTSDQVTVSLPALLTDYAPELAYFEELVIPAIRSLGRKKYADSCTIDEDVVNGLFGLTLLYLSRHEIDRAKTLAGDLAGIKTYFEGKNQFLFNDYGIALRKAGLYPEAIACFNRALDYVEDDENLYYNLARAHFENNDWSACLDHLIQSHKFNPQLQVTRDLFRLMVGLDEDQSKLGRYSKPPVPAHVAARARKSLAAGSGKLKLDEGLVTIGVEPGRARSGSVGMVELKRHGSED